MRKRRHAEKLTTATPDVPELQPPADAPTEDEPEDAVLTQTTQPPAEPAGPEDGVILTPVTLPTPPRPVMEADAHGHIAMIARGILPEWWAENPPLLVLSGARWLSTGGGQRPVQLARCWRAMGREVLYVSHRNLPVTVNEGVICASIDHLEEWLPQLSQWRGECFCGFASYYWHTHDQLRHWTTVLDICDDWEEFLRIGAVTTEHWSPEVVAGAFRDARLLTYTAASLDGFCRRYGRAPTMLVPNGGPATPTPRTRPPGMPLGQGLNVVFCGALWGRWIDWQAVLQMARDLAAKDPEALVHVIGGFDNSGSPPPRPTEPNMRHYGERPYQEAMRMIAACDVGLIPFQGAELCRAVDANKWYDYIAAGIPTVATDVMEDLRGRPYTYLCEPRDLARTVLLAHRQGRIPAAEVARLTAAGSWEVRARQVLDAFAELHKRPARKIVVWERERHG